MIVAICFVVPFYSQKWEARHDGVQPQLPSAPRDSISIDDDDDDEEAMEVDSHEHDWRLAEFAPNTTLGRQQATNSQLITAGHYNSFSFDVHRLFVLILVFRVQHFRPERARHIKKKT